MCIVYVVCFLVVTQGFCVCVDLVHGLSASELLLGLKSKGVRSPDVSRALGGWREVGCGKGKGGGGWWRREGVWCGREEEEGV